MPASRRVPLRSGVAPCAMPTGGWRADDRIDGRTLNRRGEGPDDVQVHRAECSPEPVENVRLVRGAQGRCGLGWPRCNGFERSSPLVGVLASGRAPPLTPLTEVAAIWEARPNDP